MATNPGSKRPRSSTLYERACALFPGGRELAGARVQGGGRDTGLHRSRRRAVRPRRRRQPLHRLRRLLGGADPRARRSGRGGGRRPRRRERDHLRRADGARGGAGRADPVHDAGAREDALRLLGDGGDHVGAARGARLHRAPPHHQGRRRLPRPRRFAAGQGRLGRGLARPAGLERRHARRPSPTRWSSPTTISTPCGPPSRSTATRSPRSSSSRSPPTWAW